MQLLHNILHEIYTHKRPEKPSMEKLVFYRNHLRILALHGHKCTNFIQFSASAYQQDRLRLGTHPTFSLAMDHEHRNLPWLEEYTFHSASLIVGVVNYFLDNFNAVIQSQGSESFLPYSLHNLVELEQTLQKTLGCNMFRIDPKGATYSVDAGVPNDYSLVHELLLPLIKFVQAVARHKVRVIFASTDLEITPADIRKMIFKLSGTPHLWEDWSMDLGTPRNTINQILHPSQSVAQGPALLHGSNELAPSSPSQQSTDNPP